MNLKKGLSSIFPVLDSDKRKLNVINSVMESAQKNHDVINIHRHDVNNVGDYYCAPHLYFEVLKDKYLDISDFRSISKKRRNNWVENISNDSLIIGGGGLLNLRHFEMQMKLFEQLSVDGKKTVIWGAGHNEIKSKNTGAFTNYNVDIKKFGLAGTRDFSMKNEWVPCVSCLHPIFDKKFKTTQEIGILFGKVSTKNKKLQNKLNHFPVSSNTTSLDEMVSFIGKSNTIVTDSYHAMYWAILLGKKTVVIPTTSKFYDFKYPPVIASFDNFESKLKEAQSYSGVLEECREINNIFAIKVFDFLNL
ncbi:polysaccharide pyruvyl transferase family protein [Gaetbulibacter saemankumensis]|uniref:polysaccharide pyruvyl transferase family protein n=1 Tax=Gaetbulibacter saemankumensis TaxID=311208 RepID=UPI000420EF99|nr:polysaccharide pyruvyl transferase family protein [Gaetbulibacter saemankumensis]